MNNSKNKFESIKERLKKRHSESKKSLIEKHWDAFSWASSNTKQIAAGALGSLLLLTAPSNGVISAQDNSHNNQFAEIPENAFLLSDLKDYLPETVTELNNEQEEKISKTLSLYYGVSVHPELEGKRLKHTYGYIGAEQHLMRFSGDTMEGHFDNEDDASKYYSSGMAPGRGAFGYFVYSGRDLTQKEIDQEKYYIAVQTFLADGYNSNTKDYVNFFKYRKMLVVNPQNGRAVVAIIGDAGPAVWTKKHLGGSPEVMKYLQRVDGKAKGAVLYFFIEDPEDKIPLGPIDPLNSNAIARI
jgi:hypothetical protein